MKKSKLNITFPLAVTFILMVLVVIYTSAMFYRISVSNIYDAGDDKISVLSASLGNYLDTTKSVVWVTADSVDFMVKNGESNQTILDFLVQETKRHKSQFDENYTGLYGCISGEYLDGLGWEPPADYDPTQRDWYKMASASEGELVIVPPYVDAQTGSMVISVCKSLSDSRDVLSLDLYTNHIQDIISDTDLNGKGYGFIVDKYGTIIAHADTALNGKNISELNLGEEFTKQLGSGERFEAELNGEKTTFFTDVLMDQWYVVIAVGSGELFKEVYLQLAVNIVTNTIVFLLIALFYYIAYRNEQKSARENEALKISEQQKAYEAEILRLEKSAADSANKAKGDFLAQMSHEIRTPINAVLGMNEMILRESEDSNILEYSENIQTAGRTLLSLINSILDFSKIEDGKMEIIPAKYDTLSVINTLVSSVSERARAKGLEFKVSADPQLPSGLVGDDVRLAQVIVNLLSNAVKYTDKGSVSLEIKCEERTESEVLLAVSVTDTGIGIREEDLDKLFESFSRLDEERNRHIEGTGLGMAIVTKLLALMGSKPEVKSIYGKGSTFSFVVWQKIADPAPIGNAPLRAAPASRNRKQYKHYEGVNVLVTDDNEMNLKVAKNLLKLFGIKPVLASSGRETLEIMRLNHFDIVLLDHMMPKMDGIETLANLRQADLVPEDTRIIALTANAVIGAKEKYLAAGFDDYITKPIELDNLSEKLEEYLSSKAQTSEAPAPQENTPAEGSGFLDRLTKAGFSVKSGMAYCMGDEDFYREMLGEYANSSEQRIKELEDALEKQDIKLYRTYVHAMKSTSKTVGANDVSELALTLENFAKEGDISAAAARNGELAEMLRSKVEKLKPLLGEKDNNV